MTKPEKDEVKTVLIDLSTCFIEQVLGNGDFKEALTMARKNSLGGNIWVIGGTVYRNIVAGLYGRKQDNVYDFDFILENPVNPDQIELPSEWKVIRTSLGEPRLISGKRQIDLVSLASAATHLGKNQEVASHMSSDQKLESYYHRVPLTVQALAFDTGRQKVVGEVGITAILEKKIKVYNIEECLSFCKRRKISVREFMSRKGKALGFEVDYPVFTDPAKEETVEFYDAYSAKYAETRGEKQNVFVADNLGAELETFLTNLHGKRVLDLGSGPGRDALMLKQRGLHPVCVDISEAMVSLCRERGLEAHKMDIEDLSFNNSSFDGVWAYASLVHIPKARIYNSMARISELLKPGGSFFVGMVEGNSEAMYKSGSKPDGKRFFALYQDDEFRGVLENYFVIMASKRVSTTKGETYLNYVCQNHS